MLRTKSEYSKYVFHTIFNYVWKLHDPSKVHCLSEVGKKFNDFDSSSDRCGDDETVPTPS